ncbi:hypothetical protein CBS101457_006065 [Exobasidium rhododendri]|nr:hypothetical protein CBS101457_006065 [Exobasidium rhododendri]
MLSTTPGTITAILQVTVFGITVSYSFVRSHHAKRCVQLDEGAALPTEGEIKAIRMAKELDGDAVNRGDYELQTRLRRSLLLLLAAVSLSMLLADFSFKIAYTNSSWSGMARDSENWPLLSESLLWFTLLDLVFSKMKGQSHWMAIAATSCLALTIFLCEVSLLLLAPQTASSLVFLVVRTFTSATVLLIAANTPNGPRRVSYSAQGRHDMAPIGSKGQTIVSALWFTAALPLIWTARRKDQMGINDAPLLGSDFTAHLLHIQFSKIYQDSKAKISSKGSVMPFAVLNDCWPLLRTIIVANKGLFIAHQIICVFIAVLFYAPAFVTFQIISFLEAQEKTGKHLSGKERLRQGLPYCLLLAASILLSSLLFGQVFTISLTWLRSRIRAQLNSCIFGKTLLRKDVGGEQKAQDRVNVEEEGDDKTTFRSKTQVINLISVDVDRVSELDFLISLGLAPFEILTAAFFAIKLLGWGAVIGLAASFLLQPVTFYIGKVYASVQGRQQEARDRKVTLLNEIFQAIRMIKFNAWEMQTSARVSSIRREELQYQKYLFYLDIAENVVFSISPIAVILVSYGWYTLVEGRLLTPSVAFTAMAVLEELRFALANLPDGLTEFIQTLVSVRRIQEYLECEEVEAPPPKGQKRCTNEDIYLRQATIEWPQVKKTFKSPGPFQDIPTELAIFRLSQITVDFSPNSLNLIVGKLGSGKTLLLRALLGEAEVMEGSISCPHSLSSSIGSEADVTLNEDNWLQNDQCTYVPQTAFLVNASLKENILFGLPLFESRYQATLDACGLLPDLQLLEDGEETEIGENGIGLSGGQKARVSLARAIYGRGQTVLLDDCLSAVDAHTASHIHQNLLRGPLCSERTVILVTHQVKLLASSADKIVMLEGGKVIFQGESTTFLSSDSYQSLVEDETIEEKEEDVLAGDDLFADEDESATPDKMEAGPSTQPRGKNRLPPRRLVQDEKRAKGAVLLSIYARYISAAGGLPFAILVIVFLILTNAFTVLTTRWLEFWSTDVTSGHPIHTDQWWLTGWALLWASQVVLESLQKALLFHGSLQASRLLFTYMLDSILQAPLRFHDTVSRGRLLNRFGKDFEEADSAIVGTFESLGDELITTIVNLAVIAFGGGVPVLFTLALLLPLYVLVGRLYLTAVRDFKRLSSTTKSPIIGLLSDVVSGVDVIRAFGCSSYFMHKFIKQIDINVTCSFWTNQLRWWYEQLFNTFSFLLVLFAAIIILLDSSISAAKAGFIFSFLIKTHHYLLFLVQGYTRMEQSLISIERIDEYTALEPEESPMLSSTYGKVPSSWPHSGHVQVADLRVRYARELPEVLKGVSFSIPPGAKVGVVGPTGSGKSTLASSFFRFVEASHGSIVIDEVDVSKIRLEDLRSRLQIVPQDPIILSGPLRSSIDVWDEYSNAEIRQALRDVQLVKASNLDEEGSDEHDINNAANSLPDTSKRFSDLEYRVADGGSNLSNGEKQLLCLARAILRQSKLIIFDEATSSVDYATDQVVSRVIRKAFQHSTIITIAHRLQSIIDYDYVLVMDDGKIVEYDSPKSLLSDTSSRFYKLCKASGRGEFARLKKLTSL